MVSGYGSFTAKYHVSGIPDTLATVPVPGPVLATVPFQHVKNKIWGPEFGGDGAGGFKLDRARGI